MMDSRVWIYFLISFFVLPFIISHPVMSGGEFTDINPSRYWLYLTNVSESPGVDIPKEVSSDLTTDSKNGESSNIPVSVDSVPETTPAPPLAMTGSYGGMGKGSVSTGFNVRIDSPTMKVDNRESYAASGLFDFHVVHEFA